MSDVATSQVQPALLPKLIWVFLRKVGAGHQLTDRSYRSIGL